NLRGQQPFNMAVANLYKTRFNGVPGVVYAAGVKHAYNLAEAFRAEGIKAQGVSGETPKRELAEILARYERGDIDVLINAQLLAEGWNSPRATVCVHLAPTASTRIYQQRVRRGARRPARRAERLAPGAGDAPLRPHGRAEEPLPDHRGAAQQERAAAAAGADRHPRAGRRRRLRHGDRHHPRLAAARAQGGVEDHAARAGRAAHRSPRPSQRP